MVHVNEYLFPVHDYFVQVNELKSELEARGQSSKGLKSQLQARLQKLVKVKNIEYKEGFCFYLLVLAHFPFHKKIKSHEKQTEIIKKGL